MIILERNVFKRFALILSIGFSANIAAQAPLPPAPAAASAVSAVSGTARPTHKCMKPEHPGRLATNNQLKTFNNDAKLYRECLQAFVNTQAELVKFHTEIGNSAVKEYNDYVTEFAKKKEEEEKSAAKQGGS